MCICAVGTPTITVSSTVLSYPNFPLTLKVNPQDWYGLTKDEWRIQTSNTVITQARAGRAV
jgi:hypothetical protein